MNNLAPIGVSTYQRVNHLRETIEALKKNTLAKKSELFVFSDAPKKGDEEKVEAVRRYLRTVDGFKAVHVIERKENNRVVNNRGGMKMLLDEYGKTIFLEEDVVTSPGFLCFMNQALDKYERNNLVFSITGYCPPISIPDNYEHDVFFLKRFNAWGFGIWRDRFELVKYLSEDEYERFAANNALATLFEDGGGEDMTRMLEEDAYGNIDAFDVKAMYAQFLSNQYTVYPTRSMSNNIGMDGTGVHCGTTTRFQVVLSEKNIFSLPDELIVDHRIIKANGDFRAGSYTRRLLRKLRRVIKKQG